MQCFACRLGFLFIFFIIRFGTDFDMKLMVRVFAGSLWNFTCLFIIRKVDEDRIVIFGLRGIPTSTTDAAMPARSFQVRTYCSFPFLFMFGKHRFPICSIAFQGCGIDEFNYELSPVYFTVVYLFHMVVLTGFSLRVHNHNGEINLIKLTSVFILAEVENVTHPNRYLAIATSGGLNQQRTGVTFFTFR